MPWFAQTTRRNSFIFSAVASPISLFPQSIQGSTPTPSGKTTMHSVIILHSVRVNARSSRSCTKVIARIFVGCVCMTILFSGSAESLLIWLMRCAGSSLVNFPPSSQPHSRRAVSPSAAILMMPRLFSGSSSTFLKYLPVPVTRKHLPASFSALKPIGISRRQASVSRYFSSSFSSIIRLMLPPLRSSQPKRYMLEQALHISRTKGALFTSSTLCVIAFFILSKFILISPKALPFRIFSLPQASFRPRPRAAGIRSIRRRKA